MNSKIALVTGSSKGIGRAIAEELLSQGMIVIGTGTSDSSISDMSTYFTKHTDNFMPCKLDINNNDLIKQVLDNIKIKYNRMPDILVNNAAITSDNLFIRLKKQDWDSVIATNLSAAFTLSQAVIRPMLKAKWGRIINITSVVASSGNPGQANYCAAKAGLIGMTKSLALEVASANRNITVNAVAPGFIATDMTKNLTDSQKEAILTKIPMQKMGEPKDIATAVRFLASDEASYVTGQTIHVNGGMYLV